MDFMAIVNLILGCLRGEISANYPELAGGILQIIGGASILYKLFSGKASAGSWMDTVVGWIGKVGLSK